MTIFSIALRNLVPSQLVLFAQSFGIPVNSMRSVHVKICLGLSIPFQLLSQSLIGILQRSCFIHIFSTKRKLGVWAITVNSSSFLSSLSCTYRCLVSYRSMNVLKCLVSLYVVWHFQSQQAASAVRPCSPWRSSRNGRGCAWQRFDCCIPLVNFYSGVLNTVLECRVHL